MAEPGTDRSVVASEISSIVMTRIYWHMKACILEFHAGQPLVRNHQRHNREKHLHLESCLRDELVEELEVQNRLKSTVLLRHYKIDAEVPLPLQV